MDWTRCLPPRASYSMTLAVVASALGGAPHAQDAPAEFTITQVAPRYYLVSDASANVLVLTAPNGTLLAGVQRPALVKEVRTLLARLHAPAVRFVIPMEDTLPERYEATLSNGDGGWARDGAITIMHEQYHYRMDHWARLPTNVLNNSLPLISFSHVVQAYLQDEEIHAIHDRAGYTDADLLIHFEKEGVLYLGNAFTTDGYPAIDLAHRGSINRFIATADYFIKEFGDNLPKVEPIIHTRGRPAKMHELVEYRDMLTTVRDRVKGGLEARRTIDAVVADHPTREFDEKWGHGPIAPDQFIQMIY